VTVARPHRREFSVTVFPIPLESGERLLGLVIHEVTEAKDLDRRKDAFVSIASHEIRTPMSSIMGFTELLLQRDPPPPKRKEWLERIQRNSLRVANIVDDLLNVSRIQSGKLSLTIEPVPLPHLIEETMSVIRLLTDKHEFVIAIPSECPLALADRDKLNQVLTNLLDNAVKYSPEGGNITVTAGFDAGRGHVVLSVADQGMGIAPKDQERLFTTFSRIRRPETASIRGTGLGLYIVKGLVELMKGQVWVESKLGSGSTFYVSLPAVIP
ncbi:MAG: histidine kinase, partial [Chloroflexi bacterium]|nr:histidine kinase [Chloroflexota bacterium]